MSRIIWVLVLGGLAWKFWPHIEGGITKAPSPPVASTFTAPRPSQSVAQSTFQCDGRQYCTQMTSCAEATYFLQHCPGVKMDGDHDGVPCESQWCQ
ncbi:excalibur calcium-binding domain-containing protein [Pseudomonas putida]